MRITATATGIALLASLLPLHAQERRDFRYPVYRVDFNIADGRETAAKGERHYTLLVKEGTKSVLKVGSRVPVATGTFQPPLGNNSNVSPLVSTQFTYIDIGVNIECLVRDIEGKAAIHGSIDLSNVVQPSGPNAGTPLNPTLGQTRLELEATLDLDKATIIASVDDPVTMRQVAVHATVTRVN
jgi:hypothetical protein